MAEPIANLNMIPFHHAQDYEQFKSGLRNLWTPEEIAMGQDKHHFHELEPHLQRIVRINLANLTTSDVEIMDNIGFGIREALSWCKQDFVEVRLMLAMQEFQEALHTHSYQHILESLGMSQDEQREFYQLWNTEPSMKAKVHFAADVTKELAQATGPSRVVTLLAFYWLFYEGGWFWTGFNVNWAVTAHLRASDGRPMMPGTAEQLTYIARDESQHIEFGRRIIHRVLADAKKLDRHWKEVLGRLREVAEEAVKLETEYARFLFQGQRILTYGEESHVDFLKYMLNIRLVQVGLDPIFDIETNPCPWRNTFEHLQEKNFFETRVIDYQKGADLRWHEVEPGFHVRGVAPVSNNGE